jgi:hypothetical protein
VFHPFLSYKQVLLLKLRHLVLRQLFRRNKKEQRQVGHPQQLIKYLLLPQVCLTSPTLTLNDEINDQQEMKFHSSLFDRDTCKITQAPAQAALFPRYCSVVICSLSSRLLCLSPISLTTGKASPQIIT